MRWQAKLSMRVKMLFARGRSAEALDAELRDHLERQIAENIAAGMSADDARLAALRLFGNPALLREQARQAWSWNGLEMLVGDIRYGLRTLRRTPEFAATAIVVIALGIGANVALFTIVRAVLLKPLPYRDPDQLVRLYEQSPDRKSPYNSMQPGYMRSGRSRAGASATWRSAAMRATTCRAKAGSCRRRCGRRRSHGTCCRCWECSRRWGGISPRMKTGRERIPRCC